MFFYRIDESMDMSLIKDLEVLYKNKVCLLADIINVLDQHETIQGNFNGELCSFIIDTIEKRTGKQIVWTVFDNGKNDTLCIFQNNYFVIKFITKMILKIKNSYINK